MNVQHSAELGWLDGGRMFSWSRTSSHRLKTQGKIGRTEIGQVSVHLEHVEPVDLSSAEGRVG